MATLKCMNCGLVNFAGSVTCRRCETSLLNGVPPPGQPTMNSAPLPPPQSFAPQQGFPPQQGFANYPPPPASGGFSGYPPTPPAPGGYMQYPPPPPNYPAMPPPQPQFNAPQYNSPQFNAPPMNAPSYGAPPNMPSYGAPPPQAFGPMPFYGGPFIQEPGIWQDGLALVTSKQIVLPDTCVKCNGPANGYRLKRSMSWHDPLFYLILLISPLIYVIVALIVRKRAKVHVGLCETHKQNRTMALYITWFLFLAGVAIMVLSIAGKTGAGIGFGILLLLAAAIVGNFAPRMVYASRIDERFVWIKGVDRQYISQFPQWPRYR